MVKVDWALLCERAIVDEDTHKPSYIDVVSELNITKLPTTLPRVAVALRVSSDQEEEVYLRFKLIGPDGKEIANLESNPVALPSGDTLTHLTTNGQKISTAGSHRFDIAIKETKDGSRWRKANSIRFDVSVHEEK